MDTIFHPLVMPIMLAGATGLLAYIFSRVQPGVCRLLGVLGSAGAVVCGLVILNSPDNTFTSVWVEELVRDVSFTVDLGATTLGMIVVIGSGAFSLLISIYSVRAMAGSRWEGKFYAYLLWALGGAMLVGLAGNLLVLLVGWEITTLMLFLMVNQGRRDARTGAAKVYGMLGFADACLLLAIALLVGEGGSAALSFSAERLVLGAAPLGATGYFVFVLILVAALAKAGAIPLHTWIPAAAKDAPTPVMALLPAAVDKLLGIYLLAVLVLRMFQPSAAMQVVMMVIGAVTILAAVLMAMVQHNLKRLLAFHAVSQVGYMILGIGTGTLLGVVGGLFHMINNAIYKSNLFLASGTVGRAVGSDEIKDMGGLGRCLPITFVSTAIAAAAISGIPPFNGFASKWLIYQGTLSIGNHGLAIALVVVAVFGSALTLASFVKVLYSAFLGDGPKGAAHLTGDRPRESFFLAAPMVVLAVACIVLGLAPGLATSILAPTVTDAGAGGAELAVSAGGLSTGGVGFWSPTQATGLILIGMVIGAAFVWISTRQSKVRIVRPFLAGEVLDPDDARFRVPGTHFYETVAKLPIVGPLLAHGEGGAMDVYHWSGRHGGTLVEMLRAQHTGLISLYVAWVLVGLTATLVYLLVSAGI